MVNPKTIDDACACVSLRGTRWVHMNPVSGGEPYYLVEGKFFERLRDIDEQRADNTGSPKLPLVVADAIAEYCEVHQLPFDDCHFEWERQLRASA